MNLEIIKKLSEKRDGGLKKLAVEAGMSEQNLHRCIRNNKIQASDLETIAKLLKVDIKVFFDGDLEDRQKHSIGAYATGDHSGASIHGNVKINDGCSTDIKLLQQLLAEKERTIKILMERK